MFAFHSRLPEEGFGLVVDWLLGEKDQNVQDQMPRPIQEPVIETVLVDRTGKHSMGID